MVDGEARQHRPRTTRQLAHRAVAAAEGADVDPENYHEAVRVAVNYLALAMGEPLPCPYCESTLRKRDAIRFSCPNRECVTANRFVPWYEAVFHKRGQPDVPDPRDDGGTARRMSTAFE